MSVPPACSCRMDPSPTFPYERVQRYVTLCGAEEVPRQVCHYLMDLPLRDYTPPTSNDYPRVRLMKYLFHDSPSPLEEPVPTPAQKLQLLFDPQHPTEPPSSACGYRIFPQSYVAQAQYEGQTVLRCYMGNTIAKSVHHIELSVVFEVLSNVLYESMETAAMSRTFSMECAILEALNGVNLNGIGTFYFDRTQHSGCGAWEIGDRGTNVGRQIVMGVTWEAERTC